MHIIKEKILDSDQCSSKYCNIKVSSFSVIKSSIIFKPGGNLNLDEMFTNFGTIMENYNLI